MATPRNQEKSGPVKEAKAPPELMDYARKVAAEAGYPRLRVQDERMVLLDNGPPGSVRPR